MQDAEYRMRDEGYGIPDAGFGIYNIVPTLGTYLLIRNS